jgi:hypothetical protein
MDSPSRTFSSINARTARNPVTRHGAFASMPEQQTQAYLIARDVVRRVQRTAPLFDSISRRSTGGVH